MDFSLIIPSFIAGLLTFLAPCTLPLVPGYLGFISGVSAKELGDGSPTRAARKKIFVNGLLYVIGFTAVFLFLGTIFGLIGTALIDFRIWLTRIGGMFVVFFGLYLMGVFKLRVFDFLGREKKIPIIRHLTPGKPMSSLIFGASFVLGWTPCVGPVLGTVLVLASTSGTIGTGAFLLFIFSLGLALPFLLVALLYGHAAERIQKISKYLAVIEFIGGAFLLFIGILLLTDRMSVWVSFFYQLLRGINYERLLDYL